LWGNLEKKKTFGQLQKLGFEGFKGELESFEGEFEGFKEDLKVFEVEFEGFKEDLKVFEVDLIE
jgi:hypothetical protein